MKVLLSIRPEFVEKILSGEKRFEYRKRSFGRNDVETVYVYCTMPVGKIVGKFTLGPVVKDSPESLWETTKCCSGITKDFFDQYFEGRQEAVAMTICNFEEFSPHINPSDLLDNFTPPQSYRYIP